MVILKNNYIESLTADLVSAEYRTLDQLLKESDVVIITCSLNETTKNLIGPTQFAAMKPSAVLINTSRGGLHTTTFFFY